VSPRQDTASAPSLRWGLSKYSLAGALMGAGVLALIAVLALGLAAGGGSHHARNPATGEHTASTAAAGNATKTGQGLGAAPANPPASGLAPSASAGVHARGTAVGVTPDGQVTATEVPDPEASRSFPVSRSVHHKAAITPSVAAEAAVAPGAPSDAEVRAELNQMHAVEHAARTQTLTAVPGGESIGGNGALTPPAEIPAVIARVIAGANAIADFPYVYGGGHASFVDNAYDCSGSVSYALAAGGLLSAPETSGQLESWGAPGPGRWITVYANAGHTYMYVDGVLYDTAGRSGPYASRWQVGAVDNSGYVARHWPGL
jgi:cell wall-associated NlpC family hydrolase